MNLEQVPEQLSLKFDSTPEDEYRNLSDAELLKKYAEKVKVPLKTSRYVLQDGTYDREILSGLFLIRIQSVIYYSMRSEKTTKKPRKLVAGGNNKTAHS